MRINRHLECRPPFRFPLPFGCRPCDAANDNGPEEWASEGAMLAADALLARQCARALRSVYTAKDTSHVELCSLWAAFLVTAHPDRTRLSWVLHECLAALSAPSL